MSENKVENCMAVSILPIPIYVAESEKFNF